MDSLSVYQRIVHHNCEMQKAIYIYIYTTASNTIKVIGIAVLSIGGAWVLPMREAERLDVEAKKRAIIRDRTDKILQGK